MTFNKFWFKIFGIFNTNEMGNKITTKPKNCQYEK